MQLRLHVRVHPGAPVFHCCIVLIHVPTHTITKTHACTQTYAYMYIYMYTQTHTHTHTNTHTHTQTHTHTHSDDPLGEYICLTIERIRSSHESDDDTNVPFSLTRLVSKQYHIGPEGASLGTSPDCTVCLPRESGLKERHVEFHWVPGSQCIPVGNEGTPPSPLTPAPYESESERVAGHFVMTEYPDRATTAEGTHTGHQPDTIMEVDEDPFTGDCGTPPQTCNAGPSTRAMADIIFPSQPRRVVLLTGRTFVTGLMEWSITALPPDTVLLMKMFAAVRNGSLERLKSIVDGNHGRQTLVPHVAIASDTREVGGGRGEEEGEYSHSILMAPSELGGVDLNAELCLPSLSTLLGEEPKGVELTQTLSSEAFKSAVAGSSAQSLPASRKVPLQSHSKLLLHVAIDNDNLEMVQYLLEQGADVSPFPLHGRAGVTTNTPPCTHTHPAMCSHVVGLRALMRGVHVCVNSCLDWLHVYLIYLGLVI